MPDELITGFFSAAGNPLEMWKYADAGIVTPDPDPKTCQYTHFDLSTQNLGYTKRYNCWGFTFVPRRYWLTKNSVNTLLTDNCDPVADGSVEVGDVIRYQAGGSTTHTGRVWATDGAGHATLIRSKWGGMGEYIHVPSDVPGIYGTEIAYFRQKAPLLGNAAETNRVSDFWMKDSPTDNAEQGLRAPWWTSPDILVDVPPYDGAPDLNPVFDHPNRIWARVHNRGNQRIDNGWVRFYWADPSAGLPAASWNLVPSTPGHPNPVGPISINAGSDVATNYVEWTPTAAPAHQCLLAIAYINDDPRDSNNPDPLVYPFEIPWDNNIAQRNVHVVEMANGAKAHFTINIGNPLVHFEKPTGTITALLTFVPARTVLRTPTTPSLPKVSLGLKERIAVLRPQVAKRQLRPPISLNGSGRPEKIVAAATLPLALRSKQRQLLHVDITVPKDAPKGAQYAVHILQNLAGAVTGGYTILIKVRP